MSSITIALVRLFIAARIHRGHRVVAPRDVEAQRAEPVVHVGQDREIAVPGDAPRHVAQLFANAGRVHVEDDAGEGAGAVGAGHKAGHRAVFGRDDDFLFVHGALPGMAARVARTAPVCHAVSGPHRPQPRADSGGVDGRGGGASAGTGSCASRRSKSGRTSSGMKRVRGATRGRAHGAAAAEKAQRMDQVQLVARARHRHVEQAALLLDLRRRCRSPCPTGCSRRATLSTNTASHSCPWPSGSSTGSDSPRRAAAGPPGRRSPRADRASARSGSARAIG